MMINESFKTFRNACDTSTETFGKLESLYNLALKAEPTKLSESQRNDFEIVFSQKMIAFYETIPDVALTFVASFITELFKRRFSAYVKKKKKNCYLSSLQLEPWEHVLRVIVIGLETYSASHPQKHSQLGEILYKPLFGILSSTAGLQFSIRLKIEIFGFLSDLAEASQENRELLRERDVLGGPRLGVLISSTNEYLVLVILLQLLESMISDNEDEGAVMDIGKDVFQNLKIKRSLKQASPELLKILQGAGNTAWDLTADRLIHAMATTDTEKPKPFSLASTGIRANDKVFSHPEMLRHLYMDNGAFIVNIEDEGGIDCLDIAFKSVVSISFREILVSSKAEISLSLSSPPMMATEAVPSKTNSYAVIFEINLADLERFKDALKCRGLDKLVRGVASQSRTKQSVASQPLDLNNISCISLEEKSLAVEQFYHTSTPEPMVFFHKEAVGDAKFPETDITAFTSNNKSASPPPIYLSEEECLRPLNFVREVQTPVGKLLVNNNGDYKEPKKLQNPDKLVDDAHKSMLKRKRNTAELSGSNPKSKFNEGLYYNSQFLTKKAPISTRKYKARRRVLSSAESSSSEDDIIPLASPVRINDTKPLIKLNTDRPERLILPTTSKTKSEEALKPVPADPSILGKPRPKPKPKRRKVIEEPNSDEFEELPVLLKKTPNEKMTVTKQIPPENAATENGMNVYKPPTPQTIIVEKPEIALPIVEASSPFKGKDSELGFLNDEEPAQDVEMDISEKLNAFNDSDRDDDMDKSILSLRAERQAQDSVNVSLTLVHELPRVQTKVSHTKTKVMPPLKSALKSVSHSESSVIDLTHLADSPRKKNVGKLLECDPKAHIQSKSYPADNTVDNKDSDMGLTDTSNTSRTTAQLPTVTFKEYSEEIKDCSSDVFGRHFVRKLDANKDSHSTRLPPTLPFKNMSKRICKEAPRCAPQKIDSFASCSKVSKFLSEDVESVSSSQEGIPTPEQRLVIVLDKIHETIIENLGKKIKGTSATGNAISRKFRLYAAEELEKMLQESIKHRQNTVVLEHKYGTYHKNLKGGLEEIRKSNQEIKKTLEQVVQDHDTLSLVRKMPARLAPRPKFL